MLKCLSLKQPWASLVVNGIKPVENREWKSPYRGPLYIHASKNWDEDGYQFLLAHTGTDNEPFIPNEKECYFGGIIGKVLMVDCVTKHNSSWFFGPYGFVFKNPIKFQIPIKCKGQLKIYQLSPQIEEILKQSKYQ